MNFETDSAATPNRRLYIYEGRSASPTAFLIEQQHVLTILGFFRAILAHGTNRVVAGVETCFSSLRQIREDRLKVPNPFLSVHSSFRKRHRKKCLCRLRSTPMNY